MSRRWADDSGLDSSKPGNRTMSRKTRTPLADRVVAAAEAALAAEGHVSPMDVLLGIGWLDASTVERWRRGQIDCLEDAIQTKPSRIPEALKLFSSWVEGRGLPAGAALQSNRRPCDRGSVPDPPGFGRAFREEARTPGGESRRRPGTGGGPAAQQGVDLPPVRRHRRSAADGNSRAGMPALRRPRRPRIPRGGRCPAHAAGQGEEHAICSRRALQPESPTL